MKKRRVIRVVTALLLLIGLALLIPRSPIYLPKLLLPRGQHHGYATDHWLQELRNTDPEARYEAIFCLGAIGSDAPEAVPALAAILHEDPDRNARRQASLALSKMAPVSRAAVPELAQALADEELWVRMNAAVALCRLRADARPAIPALIVALQDDHNQTNLDNFETTIQERAALALAWASEGTDAAVPALTTALEKKPSQSLSLILIRALGEIGPAARAAVPQLHLLLGDDSLSVRNAAQAALRRIETAQPAPDEK
jgi:HEAT repeat protein